MRIVMLHTQKRNPPFLRQLLGHQGRVIPRMKICRDDLRPHFQKRLCLFDRVLKCLHRPQVRQISDIGRRVENLILSKAKRVFQFTTDSKHLSLIRPAQQKWKRRVSS